MNTTTTTAKTNTTRIEWRAGLWRDIQSDLESRPGNPMEWRADSDGSMGIDTKGYTDAIRPLTNWIEQDPEKRRQAGEVWNVRFGIRNSQYRPTYADVAALVKTALGIRALPPENPDAYKPYAPSEIGPLGIPSTTVDAAYKDIAMPKQADITLDEVPTHDKDGALIGEGRRRFLLCYHRMRGSHHPDPANDGTPRPRTGRNHAV